jgi:hypothetical protein
MSDQKLTIEESGSHSRGKRLTMVLRNIPSPARAIRSGYSAVARNMPGAVSATQSGIEQTTTALRRLPDSTLRSLAAGSMAVGAGLYLAGKHRVAVAAGLVPTVIVGVAILGRPAVPVAPVDSKS